MPVVRNDDEFCLVGSGRHLEFDAGQLGGDRARGVLLVVHSVEHRVRVLRPVLVGVECGRGAGLVGRRVHSSDAGSVGDCSALACGRLTVGGSQGGEIMKRYSRRGVLLGLGLAATGLGCGGMNPFVFIPHLLNGGDAKAPAEFPLVVPPKKTEAKVVVIVSARMGMSPDLAGVDRMLNAELVRILDARMKENEQKVQVLKTQVLDTYKSENPNWRTVSPQDL